ncbi:protein SERAC1 isoform X3 [Bacillus rossius redtenbacheri]|uniref:protein SERAC1 isoform X3 n=1 Tax=Bacillus rossius redtenbacheri TaxID=93214 RepID=UPI002FDCA12F
MLRDERADKEAGEQARHEGPCDVQEAAGGTHYPRTWYVASYVSLLLRLVATAYYAWLRNQRLLLDGFRRQLVPAISSLSVTNPSSRVLRMMRLRAKGSCDRHAQRPGSERQSPEKSVTCNVLHDPGTPIRADIIFIHGLHGSLEKTWKQGLWDPAVVQPVPLERQQPPGDEHAGPRTLMLDVQGQETRLASLMNDLSRQSASLATEEHGPSAYSPCWPRDWLPLDCPGVRVIALNYTTDPFLWRPLWVTKRVRSGMLERSREMMSHLREIGVGNNPIIWVGHSKGGVFVKQIIIDAFESSEGEVSTLCRNTRGIMFYSVPHRGSSCADINLPLLRQSVELTEVQLECPEVLSLHARFLSLIEKQHLRAEVFSFIETIQTFMSFLYITIVTMESADAGIGDMLGVPLDHRNICKPSSRQCILYRKLAELINRTA